MWQLSNIHIKINNLRPISEVPTEVWDTIFGFFEGCTLSLKSFRLVCRHWARLTARALFSIAYLDAYNTSWSRLRKLCLSPYATYVKTISWSPLVLYGDCLDCETWYYSYPNILRGADDIMIEQLYKAFCQMYITSVDQGSLQPSVISGLLGVLSRLRNCHNVVICDDMDLESRCVDKTIKRLLQHDQTLWETTSMWARTPRLPYDKRCSYVTVLESPDKDPAELESCRAMWTVLTMSSNLETLTRLNISLWEVTFADIYRAKAPTIRCLPFNSLHTNLKSCRREIHYDNDYCLFGLSPKLNNVYVERFLRLFAHLQELCIGSMEPRSAISFDDTFVHDRLELRNTIDQLTNNGNDSPQQDSVGTHSLNLEQPYHCHQRANFPHTAVSTGQALLFPRKVPISELNEAMRSYMIIDLRPLVFWLIDSREQLRNTLTLRFLGSVFLFGITKRVFHATVSALSIHLSYDDDTVFFYETVPTFVPTSWQERTKMHLVRWPLMCADPDEREHYWYSPQMLTVARDDLDNMGGSHVCVAFKDYPRKWKTIETEWTTRVHRHQILVQFSYECTETTTTQEHGDTEEWLTYEWVDRSSKAVSDVELPINTLARIYVHPNHGERSY